MIKKMKFTVDSISGLKPGTYKDTIHPYLYLRVGKTRATWFLRKNVRGRGQNKSLGYASSMTPQKARAAANDVLGTLGAEAVVKTPQTSDKFTFKGFFDYYLEKHAKRVKRSWKQDVSMFNAQLKETIGDIPLGELAEGTLQELVDAIGASGKKRTANRIVSLLHVCLGKARKWGYITKNPAADLDLVKGGNVRRKRFIEPHELEQFFVAVKAYPDPDIRDIVVMLLLTGARKANVLSMRWDQIDFEAQEWRIRHAHMGVETKSGDDMALALYSAPIKILKRRFAIHHDQAWVFPSRIVEGAHISAITSAWGTLRKKAGLEDLTMHDLRRTFATYQNRDGANTPTIGRALGHTYLDSAFSYTHFGEDLTPVRKSIESGLAEIIEIAEAKKLA